MSRSALQLRDYLRDYWLRQSVCAAVECLRERPGNILHWEWERGQCFAFKGMTEIGTIDDYRCGVIYRIECWLEALGVEFNIDPKIDGCLMHTTGTCFGEIRILLDA
jgi:hypothetical protein